MNPAFDELLMATARLLDQAELAIVDLAQGARGAELRWTDRRLLAFARAERPDRFTLFCDVGAVPPPLLPALAQRLLQSNLVLAERGWGAWGIEAISTRLIYATGGQVSATTPTHLCQVIERLRAQAAHWQASLLQEHVPDHVPWGMPIDSRA